MTRLKMIGFQFVDIVPSELQDGIVYISIKFATAIHKCCCGCGSEVVTPLSPAGWELIFKGVTISLYPSIGNWSLPCKSHYWIRDNRVTWARKWSEGEIKHVRQSDHEAYNNLYKESTENAPVEPDNDITEFKSKMTLWRHIKKRFLK